MSFQLTRALLRTLPLLVASLAATSGLVSCATSSYDNTTYSSSTPYSMRYKYGGRGTWFPDVERRPSSYSSSDNLLTWLFGTDDDSSSSRGRSSTAPAGPVIPATKVNSGVLARSNSANTRVVVDIGRQKAFLLVDGAVAVETPVSTARSGKYTPRGSFRVTERVRSGKISTIYGVGMPYWMRLSGSVYGVHAGYLPGYPASAGCIRLPSDAARLIYDHTKHGTRVSVHSSWDGA